jgi:hypothetical protein
LDLFIYHQHLYGSEPVEEETDIRKTYHSLFNKYKVDLALQGHNHVYKRTHPITFNADDNDASIVQDYHPIIYKNPNGSIFVTVGIGGANDNDMALSSLEDFQLKELVSLEYKILH